MKTSFVNMINEQDAARAFSRQSAVFDALYKENIIIQYKRARVRSHAGKYLPQNSNILELNAGTGEDAVYFAQQGHTVHATDISAGMQQKLREKAGVAGLDNLVTTEICSFTQLENLANKGPYDLVFSNFAGLNCTGELDKVLRSFAGLLKTGGVATLVIMPRFCLWETLLALRGNFKNAFRRFKDKNGVTANVEGVKFLCWYYKPSYIIKTLRPAFDVLGVEGLCTIVPPSYFENFPKKFPRLYKTLTALENRLKDKWPWKYMGDYFIISLKKR
jgi:ubiquinone/menaquinone biosynthesis C-methylase UbiE